MFIAVTVLTTILIAAILNIVKQNKSKKLKLNKILFRQTSVHEAVKYFLPKNSELKADINRQSKNSIKRNTTKVIKTPDNKVYWVANNVFYYAELVNGEFDPANAKQINTENLSKKQLEELLFILDNLNKG